MSPNDVKAIKLLAQEMGKPERGYNPIEKNDQARAVAARFNLLAVPEVNRERIRVMQAEKELAAFQGSSANHAIVYTACDLIHPGWRNHSLFGIDYTFTAAGWEDAAGPE